MRPSNTRALSFHELHSSAIAPPRRLRQDSQGVRPGSGGRRTLPLPRSKSAIGPGGVFPASRWFTRDWTLQELIVPPNLQFISSSWTPICAKAEAGATIEEVTGIPLGYLVGR
ncbi:hypothetical protein VUR80DRAFT_1191 [Thermomyces stellatus]